MDNYFAQEPPSVLIVDDTADNLRLLKNMLNGEGYRIRIAPSGAFALRSILAAPPDLILLDIRMPGMDGLEVCRRLKEDDGTRDIPVIFITALASVEEESRGLNLGALDYITKPFSPDIVRARVRRLGLAHSGYGMSKMSATRRRG
jgi:putative two-component system response regulator